MVDPFSIGTSAAETAIGVMDHVLSRTYLEIESVSDMLYNWKHVTSAS